LAGKRLKLSPGIGSLVAADNQPPSAAVVVDCVKAVDTVRQNRAGEAGEAAES
jgi:hypothetical protein